MKLRKCKKTKKSCHPDKVSAIIAMKRLKNKQLSAYECPFCHSWHFGKSSHWAKINARFDQLIGPDPIIKRLKDIGAECKSKKKQKYKD